MQRAIQPAVQIWLVGLIKKSIPSADFKAKNATCPAFGGEEKKKKKKNCCKKWAGVSYQFTG